VVFVERKNCEYRECFYILMARPLQLMTHFSTSFGTAYNCSTELFSKFIGRKTGYFVAKGLEAHEIGIDVF
jgi:hypothetical protein